MVDRGRRVEPVRAGLSKDAGRCRRHRAHPDDRAARRRDASVVPRGSARRLFGDVVEARRRAEIPRHAGTLVEGAARRARPAVRDAMAHDPHCGQRGGAGRKRPRAQSQRTEQAGRCQLVQADEICRHLVGHDPRRLDLGRGAEAWRDNRAHEGDDRFRGEARLRRRPGRGLEQRLERQLVRPRRRVQLYRGDP